MAPTSHSLATAETLGCEQPLPLLIFVCMADFVLRGWPSSISIFQDNSLTAAQVRNWVVGRTPGTTAPKMAPQIQKTTVQTSSYEFRVACDFCVTFKIEVAGAFARRFIANNAHSVVEVWSLIFHFSLTVCRGHGQTMQQAEP